MSAAVETERAIGGEPTRHRQGGDDRGAGGGERHDEHASAAASIVACLETIASVSASVTA